MATIELGTLLQNLAELGFVVTQTINGLEDLLNLHLGADDREHLLRLLNTYRGWDQTVQQLTQSAVALQALGYPVLPTLQIAPALAHHLHDELVAVQAALALLLSQLDAVSGRLTFGPPVAKPEP